MEESQIASILCGRTSQPHRLTMDSILEGRVNQPHQLTEVLLDVQNSYGYIPEEAMRRISKSLGVALVEVYRVTSFYKAFKLRPSLEGRAKQPDQLMKTLLDVQKRCGYIDEECMRRISEILGVPFMEVYRVVSFYKPFRLRPPKKDH